MAHILATAISNLIIYQMKRKQETPNRPSLMR